MANQKAAAKDRRMTFYVSDQMARTLKAEAKERGLLFAAYLEQLIYAARMAQSTKRPER